jgi:hypothetical protein
VEEIIVANTAMAFPFMIIGLVYILFLVVILGSWIYLLIKVSEISRSAGAIAGQLDLQNRSLASLAESVAVLARNSTAPKPEPPALIVQ